MSDDTLTDADVQELVDALVEEVTKPGGSAAGTTSGPTGRHLSRRRHVWIAVLGEGEGAPPTRHIGYTLTARGALRAADRVVDEHLAVHSSTAPAATRARFRSRNLGMLALFLLGVLWGRGPLDRLPSWADALVLLAVVTAGVVALRLLERADNLDEQHRERHAYLHGQEVER